MVTLQALKAAQEKLKPYIIETPIIRMENLDARLGCQVYLKPECMQRTHSFKIRGALNKMLSMEAEALKNGVVAASSGNHGKGVAFVARLLGIKATIVVPDSTPNIKVEGIEAYGAQIVKCPYEKRHEVAGQLSRDHGYALIHPYDDEAIIAGQGTIGLEIMAQLPEVDKVIVPIGGGGLIGGIASAVKLQSPDVQVIGVEPALMPRYSKSLAAGERILLEPAHSIADAILTLQPGEANFPIVQEYVDQVVAVAEEKIPAGSIELLSTGKILAEFSSAIVVAAALNGQLPVSPEDKVCFVISGGNVDPADIVREMSAR
ncbi:threonine/serine dehydratase [Acidaminobacter hydrogenoformans]|uniref:threonine ammonia-lyase n=1 Tax=Acidaminobacter hydrogenoformans DSM 2784 TaxID=1120920 RepID=A0A1G5S0B2_9FIRM|nr:threonine/serine dehydratase [Acidaminobacter hydrogenoformans]SCZ79824.1 threonine dehydratase [Acidaminobacter hydrogenoformans DSM 2784]